MPLLWFVVPFGVVQGSAISGEATSLITGVVLSAVALMLCLGFRFLRTERLSFWFVPLLAAFLGWFSVQPTVMERERAESELSSGGHRVQARVVSAPRYFRPGMVGLPLELTGLYTDSDFIKQLSPYRVLCTDQHLPWRNVSFVELGDEVVSEIYLSRRKAGGFWCRVATIAIVERKPQFWALVADRIEADIYRAVGRSEDSGLFLSVVLGRRDKISRYTEESFRRLGILHLLVLSGFQLSLVFLWVRWIIGYLLGRFQRIRERLNLDLVRMVTAFGASSLLVLVTGCELAAVRAWCGMLSVVIGTFMGSRVTLLNSVVLTLLGLLLWWPGALVFVSVQLTYAALLGILLSVSPSNVRPLFLASGWRGALVELFKVSWWCTLTTSLVTIVRFGSFSWMAFVVNPVLSWIISVIVVPAGLVAIILLELNLDSGWMVSLLVWLLGWLKWRVIWLVDNLGDSPAEHKPWLTYSYCLLALFLISRRTLQHWRGLVRSVGG